ncbi:MAG TPA: nucleotide exchange factor GrpE [Kiritimatiellia bacterium]|nr:nucleotide exchange factor GrpE [Kiritimatiellia bacterium]HRZ12136.1 nucleotide exchange factor GrpE [Kiritimatiellia bacterium]HSA18106.1 nucleotide exchange factor GrpE [Kiritimatiellia bacterium]
MKKHSENKPCDAPAPAAAEAAPAPAGAGEEDVVSREIETLKDQMLRLQADFDNYRKRALRDRQDQSARAAEDLLRALLPVSDHFEMGLKTAREHGADPAVVEGFQLVLDQFQAVLRKAGLEPVPAEGQPFDPAVHEAVSHLPSETVPADAVIEQTRAGYRLGGKLLRAAQVVVSRGPEAGPETEAE